MAKRLRHQSTSGVRDNKERALLKKLGKQVHKELYDRQKSIEWLSFEAEVSRATIRHIFDADRNIGILIYDRVARALGYGGFLELVQKLS